MQPTRYGIVHATAKACTCRGVSASICCFGAANLSGENRRLSWREMEPDHIAVRNSPNPLVMANWSHVKSGSSSLISSPGYPRRRARSAAE